MRRRRPLSVSLFQTMASPLLLMVVLAPFLITTGAEEKLTESEALMKLKLSLHHNESLPPNWNPSGTPPPCTPDGGTNWGEVICSSTGKVWGLQLENMHLSGDLNLDLWRQLPELRTISFRNNEFDGPFPYKMVKALPKLRSLYLSRNKFSGKIPDDAFAGRNALRRVVLSNNSFSGKIPSSLTKLPRLVELRLEGNRFQGGIPNFEMEDLSGLNVADNQLEGPIPKNLRNISAKAFAGNKGLCGPPFGKPCSIIPPPSPSPSSSSASSNNQQNDNQPPSQSDIKVESDMFLLMLCLAIVILLVLIVVIAVLCSRRKQQHQQKSITGGGYIDDDPKKKQQQQQQQYDHKVDISSELYEPSKMSMSTNGSLDPYGKKGCTGKLVFVKEGYTNPQFDLAELLKASAEVLGSGNFGSAYKAVVTEDEQSAAVEVVVKRYRQMNKVGNRQEFHEQMARMGRLRHPNVLPMMAYFYRKEEKLILTEFVENGSLANHLHGDRRNQQSGSIDPATDKAAKELTQCGLDWPTRLRIIKGVARGLAYLDSTKAGNSSVLAHGHLKSSNVLLNESYEAVLCDHGLLDLINQEEAKQLLVSYKSPDFYKKGHLVQKTDVWCLGILILEVLTGTFPPNYLPGGEMVKDTENLVSWVDEVASLVVMSQESGDIDCNSVTDSAMGGTEGSEREIRKLLDIGLSCCQIDIDKRWTIKEAVEMIEQIKERDDFSNNSSFASLQEDGVKLMELT